MSSQRHHRPRHPTGWRRTARRLTAASVAFAALPCLGAVEPEPNILEARTAVAAMVDRSLEMLEPEVSLENVEGWAVFSGDRIQPMERGVGMAEDFDGETWFLQAEPERCLAQQYRQVLVFRDQDLFQSFRQGEMQGAALERARREAPSGRLVAFRFQPGDQPELEPTDLSGCRFALHKDLQRALVAEPSRTKGLVEEDDVDVDDN